MISNDKQFKEAVGGFIIAFSELEYGLGYLSSFTEDDLRNRKLLDHLGLPFERKFKNVSDYVELKMPETKEIWSKLKSQIGQLNRDRRFIAHGIVQYQIPISDLSTYVKEKSRFVERKFSSLQINKLTNELREISTGEYGVNGVLNTLFITNRINEWNELVNDDNKIVYRVSGEILSNWKGKPITGVTKNKAT
jgi:hypothetical protein